MSFSTGGVGTNGPWVQTAGNDLTVAFPFAHKIYDQGDVVVAITVDATLVTTIQTITTEYTVADVAADAHDATTPTITMLTAPATGETHTMYRVGSLIQNLSFETTEFWQSLSAEQKFDLIVMDMQWLYITTYKRAALYAITNAATPPTLEALIAAAGLGTLDTLVAKATAVDGDLLRLGDSEASYADKKLTLANLWVYIAVKVAAIHYLKSEHLNTSAGIGDAGKPIKLDAGGKVDATMIEDGDVAHDNTAGAAASVIHDAHPLLIGRSGGQIVSGSDTTAEDLTLKDNTVDNNTVTVTELKGGLKGIITVVFDGGGSALTTGAKSAYVSAPQAGTITKARLLADQSGSIVIDIWKDSYANFPPTDADSITASAPPTLTAAQKSEDSTLTGWTKTFLTGDVFEVNIDSATTITKAILTLDYDKTGV